MKLSKKAERLYEYYQTHGWKISTVGEVCKALKTTPRTLIKSHNELKDISDEFERVKAEMQRKREEQK